MEIGYLNLIEGKTYILKSCLIDNGFDQYDLNKKIKEAKSINPNYFEIYSKGKSNKVWILYRSIPKNVLKKIHFPIEEKVLLKNLKSSIPSNVSFKFTTNYKLFSSWTDIRYWNEYRYIYEDYFKDIETINVFSRTHAILEIAVEHIIYSADFSLKEFYYAYQQMPRVVIYSDSYLDFYEKIKFCKEFSIEELLLKNLKLKSKTPSLNDIQSAINFIIKDNQKIVLEQTKWKIVDAINSYLKQRNIKPIDISHENLELINEYLQLKNRFFIKNSKSNKNSNYLDNKLLKKERKFL